MGLKAHIVSHAQNCKQMQDLWLPLKDAYLGMF